MNSYRCCIFILIVINQCCGDDVKRVPLPSQSPIPIPRTLTGFQWIASSGNLTSRYSIGDKDEYVIEIDVEDPTPYTNTVIDNCFEGLFVSSLQMTGDVAGSTSRECFGLGFLDATKQVSGYTTHLEYASNNNSDTRDCSKSLFPIFLAGRHKYKLSYNTTHITVYQDNTTIARIKPDVPIGLQTINCGASAPPLTVGAGYRTVNGSPKAWYFANGKYYSMRFFLKKYINPFWDLVGSFDFTERYYSINNRTEFPNLAIAATDSLYFYQSTN